MMKHRIHFTRVVSCCLAVLLCLAPAAIGGPAEEPQTTAGATEAFRTSWGDPDLQGVWTTDVMRPVPLQRPEELGQRTELSAEEHAARADDEARLLRDDKAGPRTGTNTRRIPRRAPR